MAASFLQGSVYAETGRHIEPLERSPFRVVQTSDSVSVDWIGEQGVSLQLSLNLSKPAELIRGLSISSKSGAAHKLVLHNVAPAFWVYVGRRHGSWEDNYFDNPSTRPHEISTYSSTLGINGCAIERDGNRLRIVVHGLSIGIFSGDLVFTLYADSSIIKQEAIVVTTEPQVAYFYNAWLTRCSTRQLNNLLWLDANDRFRQHRLLSDMDLEGPHLKVHRRSLVAEGPGGSLAVFPPPHQYFFARDETINYGSIWYRLYAINSNLTEGDFFSFGIRQTPYSEEANKAPLVNAPPGTQQHMTMFWYVGLGSGRETFDRVSALTHNDTFPPLAGYKTFTSHYHLSAVMEWRRHDRAAYTPDFVTAFKRMGVNIVQLMDFHTDGHARNTGQIRLDELKDYFALTRQVSGPEFLAVPSEELWDYFGGHWALLLPKPIYYFLRRSPGQPFRDTGAPDSCYRIGSEEDMLEVIHDQAGVMWQTHPRTKSSVGYPDKIRETSWFRDSAWLGTGFKAMPSDYSSQRLGDRALNLLDDMNNWGLRKLLIGEVDVFKIHLTDELYGHMNVNYLKLDRVPRHPDWSELLTALKAANFFVTTGEILIRSFALNGAPAGTSIQLNSDDTVTVDARVEWTFPLNFCELVWGDGSSTHRSVRSLTTTGAFGHDELRFVVHTPGAKWARFAVWDIASDGAFTQPVRFQ